MYSVWSVATSTQEYLERWEAEFNTLSEAVGYITGKILVNHEIFPDQHYEVRNNFDNCVFNIFAHTNMI